MGLLPSESEVEDDKSSITSAAEDSPQFIAKTVVKASTSRPYLDVPIQSSVGQAVDHLGRLSSTASVDGENERHTARPWRTSGARLSSRSPGPPTTWKGKLEKSWALNRGLALVVLAQFFGALMNVTITLLESRGVHGHGMHLFQILFARMSITLLLSSFYMWWRKVEYAPFGSKEVRGLLVARGLGGFFGVYGMYYSLQYLPIAEATVITFLAPVVACWACSILIHEPFTRVEQIAGVVSLLGVILIARPTSLFSVHSNNPPIATGVDGGVPPTNGTIPADLQGLDNVPPAQRLMAVGVALIGVLGAACAYTTIRWIGKRAHPLISVNYFASWCTLVSFVALLAIPDIGFRLPSSLLQWTYLIFLGISGFVMQIMLTAGLAHERSSRATNMIYTQMLFALAFDKIVWNSTPGVWSILGSSLILGSAVYVAVKKNDPPKGRKTNVEAGLDEEIGLTADEDDDSDDAMNGQGPLRGVQEVQLRTMRI